MVVAEMDGDHASLRRPGHPITIREVLSHMSGLPFQSVLEKPTLDALPLGAAVRHDSLPPVVPAAPFTLPFFSLFANALPHACRHPVPSRHPFAS